MMIVLLLLGAFACTGLSYFSEVKKYGESHFFVLRARTHIFEFHPDYNSNVTILWKKGDRLINLDKNFLMAGGIFSINKLTKKNSGRYISLDKDLKEISTYTLEVKATTRAFEQEPGDRFSFSIDLEPESCNIYFFPSSGRRPRMLENEIIRHGLLQGGSDDLFCTGFDYRYPCGISNNDIQISCNGRYEIRDQNDNTAFVGSLEMKRITKTVIRTPGYNFNFTFNLTPNSCNIYFLPGGEDRQRDSAINLVYRGMLQGGLDDIRCNGFELLKPCGILNKILQMSCNGSYEIRDQNENIAIVVSLEMEGPAINPLPSIGIAVAVLSVFFCCCGKICGRGKSKSKEEQTETAAAEPEVQYQGRYTEPSGPSSDQLIEPSGTNHFNPPSTTLSDSLVHNDLYQDFPPSYCEVLLEAQQPIAPTAPVHHDPEPKFEFKGMTFPSTPPLEPDSGRSDVYTSDKLNFL
ncbi:uncharacterized protein LOC119210710 isoform X2 [Pungitius pungitius]|uniref:uncharacterized protein LOC119210710 isoform X2 n=1 Tax=Pungitius pungitius TaxID=134920 RepID=UPI002E160290